MKRLAYLLIVGTLFFLASGSNAFANDPPHNPASSVDCNGCHGEVLFATDPEDSDGMRDANNAVCLNCHQGAGDYHGTNAPPAANHDSDTTGSGKYTFKTYCTDCHHPHFQGDQNYYGVKPENKANWWLATGTGEFDATEIDGTTGALLSRVDYTGLLIKAGSEWEGDATLFAAKTSDGRGALFMYNKNFPYLPLQIVDLTELTATTGIIKVKGDWTGVPTMGFAIVLGQAINRNLRHANATGADILFLDHTGENSFAVNDGLGTDGNDSTRELCNDCHTLTDHWRNDPASAGFLIDDHISGANCTDCHFHDQGFKISFVDHYSFFISKSYRLYKPL